jgi:glycosyltransferase involved in cell wall biosynthesis
LRILHVTPYCGDAWAYGGIPRLVDALTRGLARRGHHVTLCTTDAFDERSRLPALEEVGSRYRRRTPRTIDGVHVHVFPNLSNRLAYDLQFFLPFGLDSFLKQQAASFDVAHLHACRNVPGAIAARRLRRTGVPYVLAPNGTAPNIERFWLAKHAFDLAAGHRIASGAARLLAVTEHERAQLRDLGVPDRAIRVIPNPVDVDEFSPPPGRGLFRRRLALTSEPIVLFLGKLTRRKRVDVLALARLERTDARLVIAGNDMGAGAAARSLVRALGIEDRTRFTGLLCGRERLEALADADVLVYPSKHEIFGLVPLEALLSGTPVIVADDSGCAEIISRTGGGLVVPQGDPQSLQQAIATVLADPRRWRGRAAAASARVRSAFGADTVCAQLEELYSEMVASA